MVNAPILFPREGANIGVPVGGRYRYAGRYGGLGVDPRGEASDRGRGVLIVGRWLVRLAAGELRD